MVPALLIIFMPLWVTTVKKISTVIDFISSMKLDEEYERWVDGINFDQLESTDF